MQGFIEATMLYRPGHMERLHGVFVDYVVVESTEVEAMLDQGWFMSPAECEGAKPRRGRPPKVAVQAGDAQPVEMSIPDPVAEPVAEQPEVAEDDVTDYTAIL
jgi:hypothetical protein